MKIGIVSLGLIGASILKALSNYEFEICCVTRNENSIEKIKKYCKTVSNDKNILKDCDVVFVCSPISVTLDILDELEDVVRNDCIVLDVASVKAFVMEKKRKYKFIGSHPMAGTADSGFDAGDKDLFLGAKWVLCPCENINDNDLLKVKNIINIMGAEIIFADSKEHDMAVALISHAPMYIAQSIFSAISNNELAKKLASSGFRDMTRLAMSNVQMACDMINYNSENINIALEVFKSAGENLKNNYKSKIDKIAIERKRMYSEDGKNIL